MRAYIEAYGCTLNFGETREIEEMLEGRGWEITDDPGDADMAVIATCVVIDATERAMLKRIGQLKGVPRLVVTGCMATACREKAEQAAPKAAFVAPGDIESLSDMVEGTTTVGSGHRGDDGPAIVPIASGCLGSCAYCITRLARGQLRSRPADRIEKSVAKAVQGGPREVQLTAQDTAAYGVDIGSSLPDLVEGICSLPQDFRLRVGMMNPKSAIPIMEKLRRMCLQPKVFKFLHVPVQSASDRLLGEMERGYTVREFLSFVSAIRTFVPSLTVSTDLIVGYPGETQEDHASNLQLIEVLGPDIVNVTRFSPRPNTKATETGPKVVGWRAKERSREITELRFKVALAKNEALVGRTSKVLATEKGKSQSTILRTDEYKQVVVREQLELGRFYEVMVDDATPTYLIGSRTDAR